MLQNPGFRGEKNERCLRIPDSEIKKIKNVSASGILKQKAKNASESRIPG
jgi:hypothetical protein